jgi:hypothetical protein
MNKTELFQNNERLLYKQSWHYAKRYNMDFEEVKSQAFLIFCEAIDRFEENKASFTTHLFNRLRTLNDYCNKEKSIRQKESIEEHMESEESIEEHLERILFYQLVDLLSADGKRLVEGIVSGEFHRPDMDRQRGVGIQCVRDISRQKWGWGFDRANAAWYEIYDWWNNTVN